MEKAGVLFLLGGAGVLLRYSASGWLQRGSGFPWGTLAVNALGCLLFGLIYAAAEERYLISSRMRIFLLVGFVGAFTTFSTFVFETLAMVRDHEYSKAFVYWGLSQGLGFAGLVLGMGLIRAF